MSCEDKINQSKGLHGKEKMYRRWLASAAALEYTPAATTISKEAKSYEKENHASVFCSNDFSHHPRHQFRPGSRAV
jgi:hypothetical protein